MIPKIDGEIAEKGHFRMDARWKKAPQRKVFEKKVRDGSIDEGDREVIIGDYWWKVLVKPQEDADIKSFIKSQLS